MNKIKFFKGLKYEPLPKQLEFHDSKKKFKAYIGGLGAGKSHAGAFESIYNLVEYPGVIGVILAPTVRVLNDSTIRTFLKYCPEEFIKDYNRSNNSIVFHNGSEILFRNCEDNKSIDRLRNIEIGWFWIDEARGVPEYAWNVLMGRIRQKEAPLTGWITTTPKGFNWIYKKFVENKNKDYEYVAASTRANKYLPKDYVSTLDTEYSGTFAKQEIEGEFVKFEGLVYKEFNINIHVIKEEPKIMKEYILGIDFGFKNPTAILVCGLDYDKRMYIVEEIYEKQMISDDLRILIRKLKDKYQYSRAFADPSEPAIIEELNRDGLNVTKAVNDVLPGISEVANRFKIQKDGKARLYIRDVCLNTIKELETYHYKESTSEKPEKEEPVKINDHASDALRYIALSIKSDITPEVCFI